MLLRIKHTYSEVRRPQPQRPQFGGGGGGGVGVVPVTAVFPQQPGGGIQPRVSQQGVPQQMAAYGTCTMPGCPFPKRVEGSRVHKYCSRTCAQKHRAMPASGHMQNPCLDEKQANLNSACQYPPGHVGVSFEDRNTYQFLQGETPDPSDICLGNRYH